MVSIGFISSFNFATPFVLAEDSYTCAEDKAACDSSCTTAASACVDACTDLDCQSVCIGEPLDACNATCTAADATCKAAESEATTEAKITAAAENEGEQQLSYYEVIKRDGITFAYVSDDCINDGNCTLNDIMQVFVNISNFIIGISGSLVLIVTVYGGFLWLTSQGNSEQIAKGVTAMRGSLIGLLIIFGAFTAINLLTGALRDGTAEQQNLCEVVGPASGGHAGQGYACLDTSSTSGYDSSKFDCLDPQPRQCPGPDAIRCCRGKVTETTTTP